MSTEHDQGPPDEGFLSRWSKLKRKAQGGGPDAAVPATAQSQPPAAVPIEMAVAPEQEIDLASLPDIETVDAMTDITGFLKRGVPPELQRLALRKVWALDPQISGFIEVAENQYDFNVPDSIPGFGDFAPGTDLTAMIAHALGDAPAVVPTTDAEAGDTFASDGETAPAVTLAAADPSPALPDAIQVTGPHEPQIDSVASRPIEPPGRPRRHGGALPT